MSETFPKNRAELAARFTGEGVELGVARGAFSKTILREGKCSRLWSIDRWSDHHNAEEYKEASRMLCAFGRGRCVPLRMTFEDALPLFRDESLDFIYVDGYAHTGQESGATLEQWWSKLKVGGIFAGHDYHKRWKPTMDAVDAFVKKHNLQMRVASAPDDHNPDPFPSWWTIKPGEIHPPPKVFVDASPVAEGQSVILVGNGPSALLRGEIGEQIDAFDQVVRFNYYAIKGFEKQVGIRTTLWSTFGRGYTPKDADQKPRRAVFIYGEKPPAMPFPMDEVFGISRKFYNELRERVRSHSKRDAAGIESTMPSSGLVVTTWLLETHNVPILTLHGFDHFAKAESKKHHYWIEKNYGRPKEHDGDAEAIIFGEYLAAGRVKYL